MNKNPYSVLGVSENATDEEIKKAYRSLVKKYHPDKYSDSDLADLAKEKMQEVNAAYDEIQNMRKNGSGSSSYSSGNSYSGGYSSYSSSQGFTYIRQCINARRFSEAYNSLYAVGAADRGAEWNFLMGCTLMGMGRVFDARNHLEKACNMDPSNLEYRAARDRAAGVSFNGGGFGSPTGTGVNGCACSGCDMCTSLLCADCLCECCGGDLVSCC